MTYAKNIFLAISALCFFFVVLGFIKPSILLWWEHTQNRIKVLKVYGLGSLLSLAIYFLLEALS